MPGPYKKPVNAPKALRKMKGGESAASKVIRTLPAKGEKKQNFIPEDRMKAMPREAAQRKLKKTANKLVKKFGGY